MNKDQVKGTLKDAAGKVQEATGKVDRQRRTADQGHQEASRWPRAEGRRRCEGSDQGRHPQVIWRTGPHRRVRLQTSRKQAMLETIAIILLVLWVLGQR